MNPIPPPLPAYQPPVPKRNGWLVYSVIVTFLLIISVLGIFGLMAMRAGSGHLTRTSPPLEEHFVMGDARARDKIVEIPLTGVIAYGGDNGEPLDGMVGYIRQQLDQATSDKHVKAVVVRINSPGGEVVASDAIYRALAEVRDDSERPMTVVACIEAVGASGAYYVAMGADYIVANELSITASIGVILQTLNFGPFEDESSLMHKLGIRSYTFKSGKLKDILNPTRPPTEEESKLVQDLITEVYDKFVQIVADERGLNVAELKAGIADGRIISGRQAKEVKLVDELGYFEDAIEAAKELANLDRVKVVRYTQPFNLGRLLRFLGRSPEAREIQLKLMPQPLKLEPGKLYFLPAYLFQ